MVAPSLLEMVPTTLTDNGSPMVRTPQTQQLKQIVRTTSKSQVVERMRRLRAFCHWTDEVRLLASSHLDVVGQAPPDDEERKRFPCRMHPYRVFFNGNCSPARARLAKMPQYGVGV